MPRVSVIIPNYNHARYLKQRIDSVLSQTFQDLEVIILDDASTDESRQIIESYRLNNKISKIVYNNKNTGSPFYQWHQGIILAKGKYIWIAESDDWCEDNMLQHLVWGIERDEICTISYCQSYCIDKEKKISWQSSHRLLDDLIEGKQYIKTYMLTVNTIFNASMAIWRRDVYNEVLHDFMEYKFAGDKLFWIRLAQKGNVAINGRLMNYFRKHEADVSGKAIRSGLGYLEDMRILNLMYNEGLIEKVDYYKGYKKFFKEFWQNRAYVSGDLKNNLRTIFSKPLDSKISYYKVLLSVFWKMLKGK